MIFFDPILGRLRQSDIQEIPVGNTTIVQEGGGGDAPSGGATGYSLQDEDLTETYAYVGYEHESDGSWYIYRRTRANNLREYAQGASDYATAWTNRASKDYS